MISYFHENLLEIKVLVQKKKSNSSSENSNDLLEMWLHS
jgi:hypothetical protein